PPPPSRSRRWLPAQSALVSPPPAPGSTRQCRPHHYHGAAPALPASHPHPTTLYSHQCRQTSQPCCLTLPCVRSEIRSRPTVRVWTTFAPWPRRSALTHELAARSSRADRAGATIATASVQHTRAELCQLSFIYAK